MELHGNMMEEHIVIILKCQAKGCRLSYSTEYGKMEVLLVISEWCGLSSGPFRMTRMVACSAIFPGML